MSDQEATLAQLEQSLGHVFRDRTLLLQALTHRSFVNERNDDIGDNERLEFLGDAVLGFVCAEMLCAQFPNASEGELTKRRAATVNGTVLAEVARELGMGDALRLGKGEVRTGGRDKPRLLSSAFEACIAAIYRDADLSAVQAFVARVLGERIAHSDPGHLDYKTRLQERVQDTDRKRPYYQLVSTEGREHERTFVVAVLIEDIEVARGSGRSKVDAEQEAARLALLALTAGTTP